MRSGSTGSRVGWRSAISNGGRTQRGFTLLEALVTLAIVLMIAAALGPFLFEARQITRDAEQRVAAQNLLRGLLENPLRRPNLENPLQEGETAGLQWRLVAEPMVIDSRPTTEPPRWVAFRIVASVSWAPGRFATGETVRLGKPK